MCAASYATHLPLQQSKREAQLLRHICHFNFNLQKNLLSLFSTDGIWDTVLPQEDDNHYNQEVI